MSRGINHNTLRMCHLYADGHAVLEHEKTDKQAGKLRYVEVFQQFGPKNCNFQGRLSFPTTKESKGIASLIRNAETISLKEGEIVLQNSEWEAKLSNEFSADATKTQTWADVADQESVDGQNIGRVHVMKVNDKGNLEETVEYR